VGGLLASWLRWLLFEYLKIPHPRYFCFCQIKCFRSRYCCSKLGFTIAHLKVRPSSEEQDLFERCSQARS
jgi:hypothetical protein